MLSKKVEVDPLQRYAEKSIWVLDVDDCLYPIDNGLHGIIKNNIIETISGLIKYDQIGSQIEEYFSEIAQAQGYADLTLSALTESNLGEAFPIIVQVLREMKPAQFYDYFAQFYGNQYERVSSSSDLVEAFDVARHKGIEIYFYTNGISAQTVDTDYHVQKVMGHLGFDRQTIDFMRPRIYDLMKSIETGYGKPTVQSMRNVVEAFDIDPQKALMADDSVSALLAAKEVGIEPLWAWTTVREPSPKNMVGAQEINALRVRDTGKALLGIAKAYTP